MYRGVPQHDHAKDRACPLGGFYVPLRPKHLPHGMGEADAAGWAVRIMGRYRQAETQARRAQRVAPGLLAVRERGCHRETCPT